MATVFSTRGVHPRERLSYWREAMGDVPHEFNSSAGQAFLGTVRVEMLDDVAISDIQCDPCEVERSAHNIAYADCEDYLVCLQLIGRGIVSQDDRQAVNENGGFVLLDPRRPFSIDFQGRTSCIRLRLPRQALEARLGATAGLTGRAMKAHRPLTGLASGFVSMLPSRMEALAGASRVRLAAQVLDLVALAISVEAGDGGVVLSSARATTLLRLKAAIESHLCDADLKPATAAAVAGISVRYANDLLSREGFSVERFVQHRRLERCRRALEDPQQAQRMIGEIAFGWGFSDLSHFARSFRRAYGLSPADYRRRAQEVAPGASGEASLGTAK